MHLIGQMSCDQK